MSDLVALRDVTLRSISTPDLSYLRPLRNLVSFDLKLGGIRNLSALAGMASLRYFEAWQVRGLSDLGVISTLTGLQNLFLQSLPQVHSLPPLSELRKLRRLVLTNMKMRRSCTTASALRNDRWRRTRSVAVTRAQSMRGGTADSRRS